MPDGSATTDREPASPSTPPPPPSPPATGRTLRRSRDDRMLAGVCGGLGHTLGIDPAIVRIAFVLLTIAGGSGVLIYLILWLVVPEEPIRLDDGTTAPAPSAPSHDAGRIVGAVAGIGLVLLGAWMLLDRFLPDLTSTLGRVVGPALIIALGLALLLRRS